jgi:four helix bundle protein
LTKDQEIHSSLKGEGRKSKKEFKRYLYIALGSLNEVGTQILLSESLGYWDKACSNKLLETASEVGRLINGLLKSIN